MSKVTTKDADLINLHEWATANLHNLETAEAIRKTAGIVYPQDIELQLRNLKEAYHKIGLMCKEKISAEVGFRVLEKQLRHAANYSMGADLGTPLNSAELATHARRLNEPSDLGNQDWGGAYPSFNLKRDTSIE